MTNDQDIQEALDIARRLIRGGVPVFAAAPVEGAPGQYHLPKHWEKTVPSEVWLEKWQPGWGLAAVGGWACDFLDSDPRNGGHEGVAELWADGTFPLTFGQQRTPSGGDHWVVAATGLRKAGAFLPGLDLQAGAPEGVGRGFVWIAPTVRPSKDPKDAGALRAYRWEVPPDLELLAEQAEDARHSMRGIVERIKAKRAAPRERESALPPAVSADDPFLSASQVAGLSFGDRSFTLAEAQDFCRPALVRLQEAKIGEIEETANVAAATLSHFVPAFWDADTAFDILMQSLHHTAYDPAGPSDWTAEKFRAVLDGRRPPLDNWKAARKAEPPALPAVVVEAGAGEESLSTYERLRRRMMSAREISRRPPARYLVDGLLNLNTEAWMIGAPGSLKSFVALDLAGHVGGGRPWQGRRTRKGGVLYLAAEGEEGMTLRARAWEKEYGEMEGVSFLPYPVQVQSNDGQWEALVRIAAEDKPSLIILDTQARISVGLEENSAKDMGVLVAAVGMLKRATGACVMVIHHTGRNGQDARGSSALDGAQDTELKVIRAEPRSSLLCKIVMDKQKDMAEGDDGGSPLQFKVIDLGNDDEGRPLSSLVIGQYDPFLSGQGLSAEELEPWKGQHPQEWTKRVPGLPGNGTVQRRILQVLADHAHMRGLTQSEAHRVVVARWYEAGKKPDADSWQDAWNKVTSTELAVNVSGERWALDAAELSGLKASEGA